MNGKLSTLFLPLQYLISGLSTKNVNYRLKLSHMFISIFMLITIVDNADMILIYILVSSLQCEQFRHGRVVGGSDAARGSIPYIASLTRRGGHFCGRKVFFNLIMSFDGNEI